MASQEDATRNEYLKELADREKAVADGIAEMVKDQKGSAKQRNDLVKQGVALEKSHRTLGSDLTKNVQNMKDGISTTVDGMINETFGPLGGVVSTFTTGWFKRAKDNKDNLSATEATLEAAEANLEELKNGRIETKGSMTTLEGEQKKTTKAIKGGRETAEEEEKEDDKQHEEIVDALKGIGAGKGGAGGAGGDGGDGGFFPGLTLIASTLGGIAVGLVGGAWIPPVDELKKITTIFDTKFPNFTKGIKDFFGIADDLPKVPDAPTRPVAGFLDNFKLKVKNFFNFADDLPKVPDPPNVPGFMKTADDLVDARYAKMVKGIETTSEGLKIVDAGEDVAGAGGKVASKARSLMGIALPNFMNNIVTKMDESVAGLKVAAESQGIAKTAAGLGVKMAGSVFGRVFAIAGNPVFDVAAMAKDAYDIAAPTIDDNIRTSWKGEDLGGLLGGVIGGALGTLVGMPWLGVGLGNLAGEFIGGLAQDPEIVAALDTQRKNLTDEKALLASEIAELNKKILDKKTSPAMKELLQAQLDQSTLRQTQVNTELEAWKEGGPIDVERKKLDAIGTKGDELAKQKQQLEANIALAEEKGDNARVAYLTKVLDQTEKEFKQAETDYETQAEVLRKAARETSSTMAEASTSFFDKMATKGGIMGTLLSGFGLFGTKLEGKEGKNLLLSVAQEELGDLQRALAEIEGIEIRQGLRAGPGSQGFKDLQTKRLQGLIAAKTTEIEGLQPAARGAFIVNRPTYLPSSGVVVGEHATYSGKGAARGGIPLDGGPEAIVPLGSDRAGAFFDPIAQRMGANLNAQMSARIGGDRAGAAAATPNIVDASTNTNVTNNTIIRTPSPSGPNLHFEGRDFVHKIA